MDDIDPDHWLIDELSHLTIGDGGIASPSTSDDHLARHLSAISRILDRRRAALNSSMPPPPPPPAGISPQWVETAATYPQLPRGSGGGPSPPPCPAPPPSVRRHNRNRDQVRGSDLRSAGRRESSAARGTGVFIPNYGQRFQEGGSSSKQYRRR